MHSYPEREKCFDDVMNLVGELAPDDGLDVLLQYFIGPASAAEKSEARRIREELNGRFGGRHCSQKLCAMMADLLNGPFASRSSAAARHA